MNTFLYIITILLTLLETCLYTIIYKRININYNRLSLTNQIKLNVILHEYNNITIIMLSVFMLIVIVDIYIYSYIFIYILLFVGYFKLEWINKQLNN